MKTKFSLSILAENEPRLVYQILGLLAKKQIKIESINAAKTMFPVRQLVNIELFSNPKDLGLLCARLENIIEVFSASFAELDEVLHRRMAFAKLRRSVLDTALYREILDLGAVVADVGIGELTFFFFGTSAEVDLVLNKVKGIHLIAFWSSGLLSDLAIEEEIMEPVMSLVA